MRKATLRALVVLVLAGVTGLVLPAEGSKAALAESAVYRWNSVVMGGGGFVSGLVSDPLGGRLFARTDVGGAYLWDGDKGSWLPLCDWAGADMAGLYGIEALALAPAYPSRVYLYGGISYQNNGRTALMRSVDGGGSFVVRDTGDRFKAHANGPGRQNGERLVVHPSRADTLFLGTRRDGLFRSDDAGDTWRSLPAFPVRTTPNDNGICALAADPPRSGRQFAPGACVLYGAVSRRGVNLYVSGDEGQSWIPLPPRVDANGSLTDVQSHDMPQRLHLDARGDLLVTFANGAGPHGSFFPELGEPVDQGSLWKYRVATGDWVDLSPSYRGIGAVCTAPGNPDRMVCSTINTWEGQNGLSGDKVYASDDGGMTWRDVFADGMRHDTTGSAWVAGHSIHWAGSVVFDPRDDRVVWVCSGNGIWRCRDIDAVPSVWSFQSTGIEETVALDLLPLPAGGLLSAVGDYDGFYQPDPSVPGPIHSPWIGTTTSLAMAARDTRVVVRCGGSDDGKTPPLALSADGGKTWRISTGLPQAEGPGIRLNQGRVALAADASALVWAPKATSQLYVSRDLGKTWNTVKGVKERWLMPVADPFDPAVFYAHVSRNGDFLVSTDGGASFGVRSKVGWGSQGLLRTRFDMPRELWLPLEDRGLKRSMDAGVTWQTLPGVTACGAVGFGKAAPGARRSTIFLWGTVAGVCGLFRSTDDGANWVRVNDDAHQYGGPGNARSVCGDQAVFGRVYMSTPGRGIVYGEPAQPAVTL